MKRALALLCLAACIPRVTLPALPSPEAPREQREAALKRFTPVEHHGRVQSRHTGFWYGPEAIPFLTLGDGTEVWDPRDLAAVLPPNSATVDSATRYDDKIYRGRLIGLAGVGVMLVGTGFCAVGAFDSISRPGTIGRLGSTSFAFFVGGALALMAGVILGAVGMIINFTSAQDRIDAFASFGPDVQRALEL